MNRDKQIEEMARELCSFSANSICRECSDTCYFKDYAKKLIDKGYRKASEVARKIIDDIDKILGMLMLDYANFKRFSEADTIHYAIYYLIDELKKKYTKEITEEGK